MQSVKGLLFQYGIAHAKAGEQHTLRNIVNTIVFKLQPIYSTVRN